MTLKNIFKNQFPYGENEWDFYLRNLKADYPVLFMNM